MSDPRISQDERAFPCTDDSGIHDLRALSAALAQRRGRLSGPELFAAPSWAPPRPAPAARPRPSHVRAAAIVIATLAVSVVALAAVPALTSRTPSVATPAAASAPARTVAPEPRPIAPPDEPAIPEPAPIVTAPETVAVEIPIVRPARARRETSRARTAAVPPELRAERAPATTVVPSATPDALDPALDGLLEAALRGARPAEPTEALPATPSAREVTSTLRSLEREVAMCREGDGGLAATRIVIDGATGRVSRIDVSNDDEQARACVAGIVGDARFPRFSQDRFAVTFPYRL